MDIFTRRKYKRLSKLFYWLAFTGIGIFFLTFVLFITHTFGLNAPKMNHVLVMTIIMFPLFLALLSWFFAMLYYDKFMKRHAGVKEWRLRNIVTKIIDFEMNNNHKKAVDLYNTLKKGADKDMLFTFIIANSMHSENPDQKEKALGHFKDYKEWYNVNTMKPF